ncbi:MAG: hypothetical protein WC625_07035 [Caldisericia bacterium]
MENLPDGLVQLIDRFKEHLEQYKGVSYDEANTRTDFIDPLFELLGWESRYGRDAGLVTLPNLQSHRMD